MKYPILSDKEKKEKQARIDAQELARHARWGGVKKVVASKMAVDENAKKNAEVRLAGQKLVAKLRHGEHKTSKEEWHKHMDLMSKDS